MDPVDPDSLRRAIEALRSGGVVVYPTETVYGLGADATSKAAVRRVASLKGRDGNKPILVVVSSRDMLEEVISRISSEAEVLMKCFWPGPLTLILPARAGLSSLLTGGRRSIGVRIPGHPLARRLVEGIDRPLTSTSANPAGHPPAIDVARAREYFGAAVDEYLDGGPCTDRRGSTVLDLSGKKAVLVREGAISADDIRRCGVPLFASA